MHISLCVRHSVRVRSTPVASTRWCLTKPPSFDLAIIILTAATAPITRPTLAHIWAPALKHVLRKKQKLVSFVRLNGGLLLCSLQTHQVCTTGTKIEADATVIENTT